MTRQRVDTATWMARMVKHGVADRLRYRWLRVPYAPGRSVGFVVLTRRRPERADGHFGADLSRCLRRAVTPGPLR